MGRNYRNATTTEKIAIGIRGDRHSLCGAIKRYELYGKQWNGLLTLKEQCARRIALIKNEQIKCFITGYLSTDLFEYVTKDIFNLHRDEFALNYPKPLYMCQECTMDTYESPPDDCQCPNIDAAMNALNKYFFKRMNPQDNEIEAESEEESESYTYTYTDKSKRFGLIYKIPNDEMDHSYELKRPTSFFLYLSPVQYENYTDIDDCYGTFDKHHVINGRISANNKLLFVDVMRFFGGFRTYRPEPQLIFNRRRELSL